MVLAWELIKIVPSEAKKIWDSMGIDKNDIIIKTS